MDTSKHGQAAPPIVVRKMGFEFADLPRHWFGGDALRTHIVNGLHFVFPAGERFFIRSIKRYQDQVPEELCERIKGFCGQEAHHQLEHRRAFAAIEEQGYDVQSFLEWYKNLAYEVIEPAVSPEARLATTAALEHYTAVLGEFALASADLDECHPKMRQLLKWHACEEIEHKSVAFDVLQHVEPRYRVRAAGFFIASAVLFYFWGAGIRHMLRQERGLSGSASAPSGSGVGLALASVRHLAPRLLDYLKPSFHPDQHDNYDLARDYLQEIGRLNH